MTPSQSQTGQEYQEITQTAKTSSGDEKENDLQRSMVNMLIQVKERVVKNFILFALSTAVLIAFSYPLPGKLASSYTASDFRIIELCNNIIVFLISGLTLKIEDLQSVYQYKYLVIYGLICINFLTTLFCFATLQFPFPTTSYAVGLTIFCCVPTTLGVGVALTQEAKGDKIMSLFLTVVSNMLGIVSIPYLLQVYLADASLGSSKIQLDPAKLAYRLSLTVLAPSIVGMLARKCVPKLAPLVDHYKAELGMFSMANLMTIVWMSLSGARNLIFEQDPVEILVLFVVAVVIHVLYLLLNYVILLRFFGSCVPMKQSISLLIMASQKSSPVALSVIAVVANSTAEKGLLTIPCVLGQIGQIFIGSLITRFLAAWVEADIAKSSAASASSSSSAAAASLSTSAALAIAKESNEYHHYLEADGNDIDNVNGDNDSSSRISIVITEEGNDDNTDHAMVSIEMTDTASTFIMEGEEKI